MFGRNPANKFYAKIARKLLPIQLKLEGILLTAAILGFFLKEFTEVGIMVLIFSLSTLAFIHMILAYKNYSDEEKRMAIILNQVTHTSFAVSIIGILFKLLKWPGESPMLTIGLSAMCITTVINLVLQSKKEETNNHPTSNALRAAVILVSYGLIQLTSN